MSIFFETEIQDEKIFELQAQTLVETLMEATNNSSLNIFSVACYGAHLQK